MTFRPGPLKAAAALAAAFVLVRVVYRVLFHGADGDGAVVLPLPLWRLPAPFAHVEVLGPATADGLVTAAASAVPIALVILAFGLLAACVDLARLLSRAARSGPLQGIARAVAVAAATLPALADAVRAARFAARLRGERGGVRLLAPVLQRAVERATHVAAALELRGYAGRPIVGDCAQPVRLEGVTAGFGDAVPLEVPDLSLSPGTLTLVAGDTGAGKTTLLRLLSGLHGHLDGGWVRGTAEVVGVDRVRTPPRDTGRTVGVVLQHPREAFATTRVDDEIGLALELRGVATVIREARVRDVAARLGIHGLLGRGLRGLSAGEATLVAIAAAVVDQPVLLLVDEPLADLDDAARLRIVDALDALAHRAGVCVVVAEHRVAEFADAADATLRVTGGHVAPATTADPAAPADGGVAPPVAGSDRGGPAVAPALTRAGLTVRHGAHVAVDDASLTLAPGEIVAVHGPNGAGKSSLLVALAEGDRRVALVPDSSDDLFVRDSVAAECRRADRRHRLPVGSTADRFVLLLGRDPEGDAARMLAAAHPRDLSAGERRCLAIALQTAGAPAVLLIDEPTRGLDARARALVGRALAAQADAGAAVLVATHDAAFIAAATHRVLRMSRGVLAASPVDALDTDASHVVAGVGAAPASGGMGVPVPPWRADAAPPASTTSAAHPAPGVRARSIGGVRRPLILGAANAAALAAFTWPLLASAVPSQAQAAVPYIAIAIAPLAVLVVLVALDSSVRSAHTLAHLAVLAALGAAIRIASTGVGGVEALFVLLILAGRAFGPRFGLLLGAASIAVSAVLWGGVGPWLPFQMFACGWVAAGAGLLPRRVRGAAEVAMLCGYGVLASYVFGLLMNLWFWPFAVGGGASISYAPGAPLGENLASFLVYSLVTSTAGWDTLRAITTVIGLLVFGRAALAALRRSRPVAPALTRTRPVARVTA